MSTQPCEELLERFLRYAAISSQSCLKTGSVPSSEGERVLAEMLAGELRAFGLEDVEVSPFAVVTSKLLSNLPDGKKVPAIGWIVHMDTVDVGLSPDIHPHVVRNYQGGDIVVSDGTSVLGADDKSAIANVMTALDIVIREKRPHGDIYICFVPDEELGEQGARKLDLAKFPVDWAYTIDCCELGEVVWETFNAGNAKLTVKGIPAHPMSSKGVMVNPTLVVHDFLNMLDRAATPECTEGREGFIVVKGIQSNPSKAVLTMKVRDHNRKLYEEKKNLLKAAAEFLRVRHPRAVIELELSDSYANIADAVTNENRRGIDCLYQALEETGVEAKTKAMRGGTDGSYLSVKGVLTPNYFTGAHNFHSNCEFLPMSSWEKSLGVTLKLMEIVARGE